MAIITLSLLVLAVLLQTSVAQAMTTDPVVIIGDGTDSCPSIEERQNTRQVISSTVYNIIAGRGVLQCGDGFWRRVAYLNMSDSSQQCPSVWREYNINGVRACGRPADATRTCSASFYSTGNQYSRVCGQIIGYDVGSPSAFYPSRFLAPSSFLDHVYVDGVSVTYGFPRSHVWTFAAGLHDCPCYYSPDDPFTVYPPESIRNSSYCESGSSSDPIWDGQQCEGDCCSNGKSPPWFSVVLPSPTMDDLEVRICADQDTDDEDSPISLLELYVQ